MNNWENIKRHYDSVRAEIMAGPADDWAIDAYAWEGIGIQMTPIEWWLWQDIRQSNSIFYPQYPVGGVFVDYGNPKAKVAIECDGAAYHLDKEKDAARDAMLAGLGWTVYRITGRECMTEQDEETGESGFARKFINTIADFHGLRRRAAPSDWVTYRSAKETA